MDIFRNRNLLGKIVKVELDLSNFATKAEFKKPPVFIHQNLLKN